MKRKKEITTIICDLDRTLWGHDDKAQLEATAKQCKIPVNEELISQFEEMLKGLATSLTTVRVTKDKVGQYIEKKMPLLYIYGVTGLTFLQSWLRNPAIIDNPYGLLTIDLLSKNYRIIALSDWFRECQLSILKEYGYLSYLEQVLCWDNYYPKPDIRAMQRAIGKVDKESVIMLGDSLTSDIAGANNAGIPSIWLNETGTVNTTKATPTYEISCITQTLDVL